MKPITCKPAFQVAIKKAKNKEWLAIYDFWSVEVKKY
jgi:hypothetical protein